MSRELLAATFLMVAAASGPSLLQAQNVEVWKSGRWAVHAPPGPNCGTLPLLQVNGPGSIFDAKHAAALAELEAALPEALAKVCSGVREVVLSSGRTRQLFRLPKASKPPASPASATIATAPAPAKPEREARPIRTGRRESDPTAAADPDNPPARPEVRAAASKPAVPAITKRSELRSLSSARGIEDKCEVLLAWLESGKGQGATAQRMRYRYGPEMLAIFRDEPMTTVFGTTYDKTENRQRLDLHEDVISRCQGRSPSRPNPFTRRPNRTLMQYAQQFQQYRQVLDQAFLGTPGPYEPTAIGRYVDKVRGQVAWAQDAMAFAASAPPTRVSFDRIGQQRQAANSQLSMLAADEKSEVAEYLQRRQSELAPRVAEAWFSDAAGFEKGAASARLLHTSHARMGPVAAALDAPGRAAFEERYRRMIESLVEEPLEAERAKLQAIPATLPGVLEISAWKARFDAGFGDLRGIPAVQVAEHEWNQARIRVLTGALPVWKQEAEAIPADGAAITAKRRELEVLFPSREDRSLPVFVQYEAPLRAKEDQLRLAAEAELRRRQEAAMVRSAQQSGEAGAATANGSTASKAAGAQTAVLSAESFSTEGLHNESLLRNLYQGAFTEIAIDPDQTAFQTIYSNYLNSYGRHCGVHLPENKVKIMQKVCMARWEPSGECARWETRPTGLYAKPNLYLVKTRLDRAATGDTLRNAGRLLTSGDLFSRPMQMAVDAQAAAADLEMLVQINGCKSPALMRFEENLLRFAENKQAIRLGDPGPKLSAIDPLPGMPFRDQNYAKLLEDLVLDQSRSWVMNRYVRGTVSGATVVSRDGQGRPARINASYLFNGLKARTTGTVNLTFSEGLPQCLYFFDAPTTCRAADRKIVAAYANGGYSQQ